MSPTATLSVVESLLVRTFSFYIHDVRYSVPTLRLVNAPDESRARALAQSWLDESANHQAVEVVEDEETLFRLERPSA